MATGEQLAGLDLFSDLRPEHRDVLAQNLRPLDIEAGEHLVTEGVSTQGPLFIIVAGAVSVSRRDPEGTPRTLATVPPPSVIGEMEFLGEVESSATVTATEHIQGYLLPRARFQALFEAGEPAAYYLALAIGRLVSERLAATNNLLAKALAGDAERLLTVQKAQVNNAPLDQVDEALQALLG